MGRENTCRAVPNLGLKGKTRISCSKCGAIWDTVDVPSCPVCKRKVKKSKFAARMA